VRIFPGHGLDHGSGAEEKVFCFFSSEKKPFLASLAFALEKGSQPHE
jgi:hypothetical protein